MGEASNIQWTQATWNPWHGCTKVSPGCAHCYMYREKHRYGQDPSKVLRSATTFDAPLRWKQPRLVFACSWSDWFHSDADGWRDEAWDIVRRCPLHTFQILTKRPERILQCLPDYWPLDNVWLGVSVEYQRWANLRIPLLKTVAAAVRFVSCEPLLGPLDLRDHLADGGIHWVIVGGESGGPSDRRLVEKRNATWVPKPAALDWIGCIREQCAAANVPFFLKQFGGPSPASGGATLDGREWREMPAKGTRRQVKDVPSQT